MMRFRNILSVSLCLAVFSALSIPAGAQVLPLDKAVHTGKLPNGFTYYIRKNTEPKSRVLFYLVNKVGSMQEEEDQRGLAHFMEHMSFNGTRHYPKNQLVDYLQKSGVRFGADLNAYTAFDETVYQLPLPSDEATIVDHGLQIMRDWAADATLETEEINKERGVVLEEKRLRTGAQQRMMEQYFPMQLNGSRYAERLPIGTEEVLTHFTPAAIKRFYKDWYRPNLQALIVVGDIDVSVMEQKIKKLFGDLKNPVSPRPRVNYKVPLTGKNQFKVVTDPEQTEIEFQVLIKQSSLALKTRADYRRSILQNLMNTALAERLRELSQRPNSPFLNAEGGLQGFMGGLDALALGITARPGKLQEGFQAVWTEIERLKRFGLASSELERSKTAFFNRLAQAYREKDKTPSNAYVQEYLQYFLHQVASPGIETEYRMVQEDLPKITLPEVNAFIKSVIKEQDRDILVLAPQKDRSALPDAATMNQWLTAVRQSRLTAWKDNYSNKGLLSALPPSGKVVNREQLDSIGVTKIRLSNGATVLLKPTNFKNDEILFTAFSEGGTSLYSDVDYLSAANAAQLIASNGVANFSPTDLDKLLAGKTLGVQPFLQDRYEGMNGGTSPKDLETALQLLYLYFTAPRKDSGIFQNIISRSRVALAGRGNDPTAVFTDSVNAILGSYHYRRLPPRVEQLDSVDLDKMYRIYQERFSGAEDFTFIFTGSFDTEQLLPLLERYIGALPAGSGKEKAKDLGIHIPEGKLEKTIYKGTENKATVRLVYSGDYSFSPENNLQLTALGSVLQYRMTERIRETEGGAYTPQAGVSYSKLPRNRYAFTILFTCAPANVEKLVAAVNDEIEKIKKEGPPSDDLEKFQAEQKRALELQLQTNNFWLQYLSSALQNEESLTEVLSFTERLRQVSPTSVQKAAREYLGGANYIKLVLLPEQH